MAWRAGGQASRCKGHYSRGDKECETAAKRSAVKGSEWPLLAQHGRRAHSHRRSEVAPSQARYPMPAYACVPGSTAHPVSPSTPCLALLAPLPRLFLRFACFLRLRPATLVGVRVLFRSLAPRREAELPRPEPRPGRGLPVSNTQQEGEDWVRSRSRGTALAPEGGALMRASAGAGPRYSRRLERAQWAFLAGGRRPQLAPRHTFHPSLVDVLAGSPIARLL